MDFDFQTFSYFRGYIDPGLAPPQSPARTAMRVQGQPSRTTTAAEKASRTNTPPQRAESVDHATIRPDALSCSSSARMGTPKLHA